VNQATGSLIERGDAGQSFAEVGGQAELGSEEIIEGRWHQAGVV